MSFLLFQTTGGLLRNKVTPVQVSGEKVVDGSAKSSCNSNSDPLETHLCMVNGHIEHCQGDRKAKTTGPEDLGYSTKQKQAWKHLENGIPTSGCVAVPEESSVDQLVCKLVSQLCLLPDAFADLPEREFEKPSLEIPTLEDCKERAASLDGDNEQQGVLALYKKDIKGRVSVEAKDLNTDCTIQLKSALQGGSPKGGLGERPKKHVTWAPDVYDPPCTSTSHTSSQNRRRHHHHHHPKSDQKSRHKGKGSSHTDLQKKLQKKMLRKLRNTSETFALSPTFLAHRGKQNGDVFREHMAPLWDDFWSAKVSPLILPQNLVRPLSEELVSLDKIKSYGVKHVQAHKLSL